MTDEQYDEDYYERGLPTGKSLYLNYQWLPALTIPTVHTIIEELPIERFETVCDIGCAKGFYTLAFRLLRRACWGTDVSEYALSEAPKDARPFLALSDGTSIPFPGPFTWGFAKDCFEHLAEDSLDLMLADVARKCEKLFVVVPLGDESGRFVSRVEEMDTTHQLAKTGEWWQDKITEHYDNAELRFQFLGLKESYAHIPRAHGFIIGTLRD